MNRWGVGGVLTAGAVRACRGARACHPGVQPAEGDWGRGAGGERSLRGGGAHLGAALLPRRQAELVRSGGEAGGGGGGGGGSRGCADSGAPPGRRHSWAAPPYRRWRQSGSAGPGRRGTGTRGGHTAAADPRAAEACVRDGCPGWRGTFSHGGGGPSWAGPTAERRARGGGCPNGRRCRPRACEWESARGRGAPAHRDGCRGGGGGRGGSRRVARAHGAAARGRSAGAPVQPGCRALAARARGPP